LPLVLASVNDLGNGIGIFSAALLGVAGGVTAAGLGATTGAGAGAGAGVGATTGVGTGAGLVTTGGVGVEGLGGLTGAAAGFGAGAGVLDLLAGWGTGAGAGAGLGTGTAAGVGLFSIAGCAGFLGPKSQAKRLLRKSNKMQTKENDKNQPNKYKQNQLT